MKDRIFQFLLVVVPILVFSSLFIAIMDANSPTNQNENNDPAEDISADATDEIDFSDLVVEDITVGEGEEAIDGVTVKVHYRGTLTDGTGFDNSYDRGQPIEFTVGAGEMIAGFDKGVKGMKVGGKRKVTIPPELGYGDQAQGQIPANSTLIFEIELVEVSK